MSWYHLALPAPCSAGLTARKTWRHPVTGVPGEVYLPKKTGFLLASRGRRTPLELVPGFHHFTRLAGPPGGACSLSTIFCIRLL
jgi:hypothetical protein